MILFFFFGAVLLASLESDAVVFGSQNMVKTTEKRAMREANIEVFFAFCSIFHHFKSFTYKQKKRKKKKWKVKLYVCF